MRAVVVAVLLAAVLSLIGSLTLQVAGDIGPGEGVVPTTLQLAGDIGPGEG